MKKTKIDFKKSNGLIPVIIQDSETQQVLMLAYMNQQALDLTLKTDWVYFWSRSRQKLWLKGEESGNKLKVQQIKIDCDADTLLIKVKLIGKAACHTGQYSCFFRKLTK